MAKLYARLIWEEKINAKTGEPWKIEDVSKIWRKQVQKFLEEFAAESGE